MGDREKINERDPRDLLDNMVQQKMRELESRAAAQRHHQAQVVAIDAEIAVLRETIDDLLEASHRLNILAAVRYKPPAADPTEPGALKMTPSEVRADILNQISAKGGWTAKALRRWGLSWPPPKGWRSWLEENGSPFDYEAFNQSPHNQFSHEGDQSDVQ